MSLPSKSSVQHTPPAQPPRRSRPAILRACIQNRPQNCAPSQRAQAAEAACKHAASHAPTGLAAPPRRPAPRNPCLTLAPDAPTAVRAVGAAVQRWRAHCAHLRLKRGNLLLGQAACTCTVRVRHMHLQCERTTINIRSAGFASCPQGERARIQYLDQQKSIASGESDHAHRVCSQDPLTLSRWP